MPCTELAYILLHWYRMWSRALPGTIPERKSPSTARCDPVTGTRSFLEESDGASSNHPPHEGLCPQRASFEPQGPSPPGFQSCGPVAPLSVWWCIFTGAESGSVVQTQLDCNTMLASSAPRDVGASGVSRSREANLGDRNPVIHSSIWALCVGSDTIN